MMAATRERTRTATAAEVAEHLQVPIATLYVWRTRDKGPRASRVGRHLRYRWADVESWLDRQAKTCEGAA